MLCNSSTGKRGSSGRSTSHIIRFFNTHLGHLHLWPDIEEMQILRWCQADSTFGEGFLFCSGSRYCLKQKSTLMNARTRASNFTLHNYTISNLKAHGASYYINLCWATDEMRTSIFGILEVSQWLQLIFFWIHPISSVCIYQHAIQRSSLFLKISPIHKCNFLIFVLDCISFAATRWALLAILAENHQRHSTTTEFRSFYKILHEPFRKGEVWL